MITKILTRLSEHLGTSNGDDVNPSAEVTFHENHLEMTIRGEQVEKIQRKLESMNVTTITFSGIGEMGEPVYLPVHFTGALSSEMEQEEE